MDGVIACIIMIGGLISWFGGWLFFESYKDKKMNTKAIQNELNLMMEKTNAESIKYSTDMLNFIRSMISQVSVLKFNAFKDSHNKEKIMRFTVAELAQTVAIEVRKSLDLTKFRRDMLLYSQEFIDTFIIETSIMMVKELWEKDFDYE